MALPYGFGARGDLRSFAERSQSFDRAYNDVINSNIDWDFLLFSRSIERASFLVEAQKSVLEDLKNGPRFTDQIPHILAHYQGVLENVDDSQKYRVPQTSVLINDDTINLLKWDNVFMTKIGQTPIQYDIVTPNVGHTVGYNSGDFGVPTLLRALETDMTGQFINDRASSLCWQWDAHYGISSDLELSPILQLEPSQAENSSEPFANVLRILAPQNGEIYTSLYMEGSDNKVRLCNVPVSKNFSLLQRGPNFASALADLAAIRGSKIAVQMGEKTKSPHMLTTFGNVKKIRTSELGFNSDLISKAKLFRTSPDAIIGYTTETQDVYHHLAHLIKQEYDNADISIHVTADNLHEEVKKIIGRFEDADECSKGMQVLAQQLNNLVTDDKDNCKWNELYNKLDKSLPALYRINNDDSLCIIVETVNSSINPVLEVTDLDLESIRTWEPDSTDGSSLTILSHEDSRVSTIKDAIMIPADRKVVIEGEASAWDDRRKNFRKRFMFHGPFGDNSSLTLRKADGGLLLCSDAVVTLINDDADADDWEEIESDANLKNYEFILLQEAANRLGQRFQGHLNVDKTKLYSTQAEHLEDDRYELGSIYRLTIGEGNSEWYSSIITKNGSRHLEWGSQLQFILEDSLSILLTGIDCKISVPKKAYVRPSIERKKNPFPTSIGRTLFAQNADIAGVCELSLTNSSKSYTPFSYGKLPLLAVASANKQSYAVNRTTQVPLPINESIRPESVSYLRYPLPVHVRKQQQSQMKGGSATQVNTNNVTGVVGSKIELEEIADLFNKHNVDPGNDTINALKNVLNPNNTNRIGSRTLSNKNKLSRTDALLLIDELKQRSVEREEMHHRLDQRDKLMLKSSQSNESRKSFMDPEQVLINSIPFLRNARDLVDLADDWMSHAAYMFVVRQKMDVTAPLCFDGNIKITPITIQKRQELETEIATYVSSVQDEGKYRMLLTSPFINKMFEDGCNLPNKIHMVRALWDVVSQNIEDLQTVQKELGAEWGEQIDTIAMRFHSNRITSPLVKPSTLLDELDKYVDIILDNTDYMAILLSATNLTPKYTIVNKIYNMVRGVLTRPPYKELVINIINRIIPLEEKRRVHHCVAIYEVKQKECQTDQKNYENLINAEREQKQLIKTLDAQQERLDQIINEQLTLSGGSKSVGKKGKRTYGGGENNDAKKFVDAFVFVREYRRASKEGKAKGILPTEEGVFSANNDANRVPYVGFQILKQKPSVGGKEPTILAEFDRKSPSFFQLQMFYKNRLAMDPFDWSFIGKTDTVHGDSVDIRSQSKLPTYVICMPNDFKIPSSNPPSSSYKHLMRILDYEKAIQTMNEITNRNPSIDIFKHLFESL